MFQEAARQRVAQIRRSRRTPEHSIVAEFRRPALRSGGSAGRHIASLREDQSGPAFQSRGRARSVGGSPVRQHRLLPEWTKNAKQGQHRRPARHRHRQRSLHRTLGHLLEWQLRSPNPRYSFRQSSRRLRKRAGYANRVDGRPFAHNRPTPIARRFLSQLRFLEPAPFEGRYVRGHDQTSRLVQSLSGQANCNRKISRSCGDNSSRSVSRSENCSSKLERTAILNGLVFDEDCSPSRRVQRGARSYRSLQRSARNKLEIVTDKMNQLTGHLCFCGNRNEHRWLSDTHVHWCPISCCNCSI